MEEDEPPNKKSRDVTCVACLGLLQERYMVPALDTVTHTIRGSEYDADSFSLSLSLPICLSLREHSLWLHLLEKVPASVDGRSQEQIVPVKQAWKYVYPDLVSAKVGMKCISGEVSEFFAELCIEWPHDETEMKCVVEMCEEEYRQRAKKVNVYNMGVFSRQGVEKSLSGVSPEEFRQCYP